MRSTVTRGPGEIPVWAATGTVRSESLPLVTSDRCARLPSVPTQTPPPAAVRPNALTDGNCVRTSPAPPVVTTRSVAAIGAWVVVKVVGVIVVSRVVVASWLTRPTTRFW